MKKCPDCAELVKADALVCRYCGREMQQGTAAAALTMPAAAPIVQPMRRRRRERAKSRRRGARVRRSVRADNRDRPTHVTRRASQTSPAAARESAVEPATLVRELNRRSLELMLRRGWRRTGPPRPPRRRLPHGECFWRRGRVVLSGDRTRVNHEFKRVVGLEPEKLQASVLVAANERNEIAADQQFKGKMFEIEGVVENGGLFGLPACLHAGRDHRLAVKLWIRRSASARLSFETRSSHQRNARA